MTDTEATRSHMEWSGLAARLAETLAERGDLRDPAWWAAIASVPRHRLVPAAWEQDSHAQWQPVDLDSDEGLARVYSPQTLVTALEDRGDYQVSVSSSTKPDLMVRMLETLAVDDGDRVLEIGTGSGYNAALLSHRLGSANVFSIDVDPELVDAARERLAAIGYRPTLVAVDGVHGLPGHAPYDRIIATCATPSVPWAWVQQLAPGGRMLVDLKVNGTAGNLVDLRRLPDRAEGRFTDRWAAFMAMRHPDQDSPPAASGAEATPPTEPVERVTTAPSQPWQSHRLVWLLAQSALPAGVRVGMQLDPETRTPNAATLAAPDGSWAVVDLTDIAKQAGRRRVRESGPSPLWEAVEHAYEQWKAWSEPAWPRFGLTVTPDSQTLWLDHPAGPHVWPVTG